MIEQLLQVSGGGVSFLGEVPVNALITGDALASAIGLTQGTAQHTNEPWLHFELDGKTLYVAKKPYRHTVSWDQINAVGAVFGTATVTIKGNTYKVRLLTGANTNPTSVPNGWDPIGTEDSEWNRLIYAVHNGVHAISYNKTPPGAWPLYSDADLVFPSRSWCQETNATSQGHRVYRGSNGISYLRIASSGTANESYVWRPVLELVE